MAGEVRRERISRATRFSLRIPLSYRASGEPAWREGRTENISQTGVLFHGMEPIDVEVPVEVMMDLPSQLLGMPGGASLGRGRIVRHQTERSDARPAFAAAISDWELLNVDPRRI